MTEPRTRPILFNSDMVRAILDGTKTQTRRIVKLPKSRGEWEPTSFGGPGTHIGSPSGPEAPESVGVWNTTTGLHIAALYQPGDRLYVRETWGLVSMVNLFRAEPPHDEVVYRAGRLVRDSKDAPPDYSVENWPQRWSDDRLPDDSKWRPSIHMPRWASRITLEVMGVRVERVHDMTDEDAIAEGVMSVGGGRYWLGAEGLTPRATPLSAFQDLWDSINAKRGFPWVSKTWVWVVEFKRVEAPNG